mmetsp:Transcript_2781/g.8419  ORF Transcript_2781/g.8419 Transcript_2781/m.8419 type:complete len:299 (+) Transcript_2781:76-972(+)
MVSGDAAMAAAMTLIGGTPAVVPYVPAAPTFAEFERRKSIDGALKRYWEGLGGFQTTDEKRVQASTGVCGSVYGEVTADGARCVFEALGLYGEGPEAVFADLGSGVGKLAAQAYVELPRVQRVLAVELAADRHDNAREAWRRYVASGDAQKQRLKSQTNFLGSSSARSFEEAALQFRCADATRNNRALLAGVTHCYVANLCFDDEASARLGAALAATPSVRRVAALKSLGGADAGLGRHRNYNRPQAVVDANLQAQSEPEYLATLAGVLTLTAKFQAKMTWNTLPGHPGTDVLLYERY